MAIVFVILFNFICSYIPIYAAEDEDTSEEAPGGILMEPLLGLISGLGEGVVWLIQSQILGMNTSAIFIDVDGISGAWKFIGDVGRSDVGTAISTVLGTSSLTTTAAVSQAVVRSTIDDLSLDDYYLPIYKISPQEIFSNQIPALDINFINPNTKLTESLDEDGKIYNSAEILGPQIAKWYVALRNFVLVGLMIVLLYIGIRIVISSTADDKAKYKEHIKDWIVAILLVLFMHYIMAFALTVTDYIVSAISGSNQLLGFEFSEDNVKAIETATNIDIEPDSDGKYYYYTNLMGYARLEQQANSKDEEGKTTFTWNYIGYTLVYLVLVVYTVMFLIIYLKRVVYMAFLTIIAPLVALTYPIDKISDGQAQAFGMWLKDYIYNLLLQPFHLLLYTMLIGSVMDLASSNMLYAIVALGFLMPAEQLLRRFFGFEKSDTTGDIMGGVVGGAMLMNAINGIGRIGSLGKKGNGKSNETLGTKSSSKLRLTARKAEADKKMSIEELMKNGNKKIEEKDINKANTKKENNEKDKEKNNKKEFQENTTGQGIKDWASNSAPVRFANEKREAIQKRWEEPKTERGKKAKDKVIKGAKVLKSTAGTAGHYTAKVGKKVPRTITKAGLGIALGTAGVAAGIATGDWSNIAKYGAAAAGVGASVGEGVSNIASNVTSGAKTLPSGIRDQYEARRYTKSEREKIQNERADKEWEKSKEIQRMYKDAFGKDYKKAMEKAKQFREYGITNDEAIMERIKDRGIDEAITNEDIATTRAASSINTEEELQDLSDRLRGNQIDEETIRRMENDIRKYNISGNFT